MQRQLNPSSPSHDDDDETEPDLKATLFFFLLRYYYPSYGGSRIEGDGCRERERGEKEDESRLYEGLPHQVTDVKIMDEFQTLQQSCKGQIILAFFFLMASLIQLCSTSLFNHSHLTVGRHTQRCTREL